MPRVLTILVIFLLGSASASAQRWAEVSLPAPYNQGYYLDIYFLPGNANYGWACDEFYGYVIRTTDGGTTWQGTVAKPGDSLHLEYIQFLNTSVGYCSGPGGAFRSTDGGASWMELTLPDTLNNIWGGWFRDTDTGWFTGGGCGRNGFLKTTDGGATFSVFIDTTIKRSNMADPLWQSSFNTGEVWAIGNGTLWKSDDDGDSWYVDGYTGASSPWHEELSIAGTTFMVAGATNNCPPSDFNGGCIRTSTDGGQLWAQYNTGRDMFGVHLQNDSTAWAAGTYGSVYYTSNKGVNWSLYNCGLGERHMDDIFFIDPDNGWVVGQGVFRIAPPLRTARPLALNLVSPCPDSTKTDTIWVKNVNFHPSDWEMEITGPHDYLFRVMNPVPVPLPACDSVPVIIGYSATESGSKTAQLEIRISDPDTTIIIELTATRTPPTAYPVDTLIVQDVRVGSTLNAVAFWRSNNGTQESIIDIQRVSGDTNIKLTAALPLPIKPMPQMTETYVSVTPQDTGWIEARFKIRLSPCIRDTFITVRILGRSPIFNSIDSIAVSNACSPTSILEVPISNTGNAALTMSGFVIQGPNAAAFKFLRMKSGNPGPVWSLLPGDADTAEIQYVGTSARDVAELVINNDDLTKTRGIKNPWKVALEGSSEAPQAQVEPDIIDLGTLCLGETRDSAIVVQNIGTIPLTFRASAGSAFKGFSTSFTTLRQSESSTVRFQWKALTAGATEDTINVLIRPCDSTHIVIVKANVIDGAIVVNPDPIIDSVALGGTLGRKITLTTVGVPTLTVTDIHIEPPTTDIIITPPPVPFNVDQPTPVEFNLIWKPTAIEQVTARLVVTAVGGCDAIRTTDILLKAIESGADVNKRVIDFDVECQAVPTYDSVELTSTQAGTLQPPSIVQIGSAFTLVSPTTAVDFQANESVSIVVRFDPAQGAPASGKLLLPVEPDGVTLEVALQGTFALSVLNSDLTQLDMGTLGTCDPVASEKVVISNTGGLDDAVTVDVSAVQTGVIVAPMSANVPAGGTATFTLVIDPSALPAGPSSGVVRFIGDVCGDTVAVDVVADVQGGKLTMSPTEIDAGLVFIGQSTTHQVTISNETGAPREIVNLRVIPSIPDWIIETAVNGATVAQGGQFPVSIRFQPTVAGARNAELELIDIDRCTTTTRITLKGAGRDVEDIVTRFRMDRYNVMPGTKVDVPVHWLEDIRRAEPDSLHMIIESSRIMYQVDSVTTTYPYGTTDVTIGPGTVELFFRKTDENFGISGTAAILHGSAEPAIPDSTVLHFASVVTWAAQPVTDASTDGVIQVLVCGPHIGIEFVSPTQITLLPPQPVNATLRFGVDAPFSEVLHVEVYDLVGQRVSQYPTKTVPEGSSVVEVPVGDLPSGRYMIRVLTDKGGFFNAPCIIVR